MSNIFEYPWISTNSSSFSSANKQSDFSDYVRMINEKNMNQADVTQIFYKYLDTIRLSNENYGDEFIELIRYYGYQLEIDEFVITPQYKLYTDKLERLKQMVLEEHDDIQTQLINHALQDVIEFHLRSNHKFHLFESEKITIQTIARGLGMPV